MDVIEFPGLWGLKIPVRREAFYVFGIPIYWYGIIIALGFLLAILLGLRRSKKEEIDQDSLLDMILFGTVAAIIGARLYYVIFDWKSFEGNLLNIINTRKGGLAIYGGIIGAFAAVYIYCRIKKINFLKIFDFGAPYFILAQGIGRWGNFVNQEAFGSHTDLPWGMTSGTIKSFLENLNDPEPSRLVHPTFLYESLWDIATFAFLIWFRKRKKVSGEVFFLYLIIYGIGRFMIEGLRTDSLMLGSFRISRVLSALLAVMFMIFFIVRRRKFNLENGQEEIGESSYSEILREIQQEEAESEIKAQKTEDSGPEEAESGIEVQETEGLKPDETESDVNQADEKKQDKSSREQEKSGDI